MNDKQENLPATQIASPLELAASLVQKDGNMDVAKLKELLEIQQRWEAIEAKKAYSEAMTQFKANPPEILKDKHVSFQTTKGPTDYNHATLYNVTTQINKELSKYGLSAAWTTSQANGLITVSCKISHIMGHSEQTSLTAQPDNTGSKNSIQAIGSTVTYLERYTILALTGLATYDQDDDGRGAGEKPKSAKKPKPFEKTKEIMDQAYFDLTTEYKDELPDGYDFSYKKFEKAVIKHFKRMPNGIPSKEANVKKIVDKIKVDEIIEEIQKENKND